ncbi:MAG TPA: efflux RND transporter periplasmic adaptor subunit [Gemmatimonadaceae bacterium]|jgi:RND family efflux transporter MFP subunit|nr:efflux RND transporter periplasmic adaptor subunit [Gemmatimonadaceae bacterium]
MIRIPRNRWITVLVIVLAVGAIGAWYFTPAAANADDAVVARVKQGDFKVVVTSAGELRAKKFVQVQGPLNMQQAEIYQTKISTLVPEGTVVKEGDVVAELDRSGIAAKMAEVSLALQKAEAQLTQAQLDSTLNLATAREDIKTQELSLEEKRLAKEQAAYESPSVKRQVEIEYEKATRQLAQAKANYITKTQQAVAKMAEVGADVQRQRNKLKNVQDVLGNFTIRAPSPGMVIYVKEWNGKKKGIGSQVSAWDPTVATLPDLGQMESLTYVNEIDVRKISAGQSVTVSLDSDPTKKLSGKVTAVANVGEQRPNADAKVFEVKILLNEADTTLRPGMTTSNAIETNTIKNALFVPLEAVGVEGTTPFVYKRDGASVTKQQVETGLANDDEIVIAKGLGRDDRVLLTPPSDADKLELRTLPGAKPGSGGVPQPGPADTPSTKPVPVQPTPAAPNASSKATTDVPAASASAARTKS